MNEFKKDYSEMAGQYDVERFEGQKMEYITKLHSNTLKKLLPDAQGIHVLDVGCGTGRGAIFLARHGYNVVGLDYTNKMLEEARNKIAGWPLTGQLSLQRGDAFTLPYREGSFDCIISLAFLHLFPLDQQKILINEMIRVLKAGGIVICEFNNYYRGILGGGRTLKQNSTLILNRISEMPSLFDSRAVSIDRVCGSSLPYVWRIFRYFPWLGERVDHLSHYQPLAAISDRFFVKAIKHAL